MNDCEYCDIKICCKYCEYATGNKEFMVYCINLKLEGYICSGCKYFERKENEDGETN
jgi:hypothetical protein